METQQVEVVKRPKGKAGKSTVKGGKEIFDSAGNLKTKNGIETILQKKDVLETKTKTKGEPPETPLKPVEPAIQALCDVNFIQNQTAREELVKIIQAVQKMEQLTLTKDKDGCLDCFLGKKRIVKLIPYVRIFSVKTAAGPTIRLNAEETLRLIRTEMDTLKQSAQPTTK